IRGIVKRAAMEGGEWEVLGSIQAYNGILWEPTEVKVLDLASVEGIQYRGGTIIETTNKGGPFGWPVYNKHTQKWDYVDRSDEMIRKLGYMGIDAVIAIGGDGSQVISQQLMKQGLDIVGVPKTIDNDLSATDFTFGFQTAVQIATEAVDKLKTTAASHNRTFILEVMGRDAGWIALHTAIAGGADVCLIPEIPYDIEKVVEKLKTCYDKKDRGYAIIVVSEGAMPKDGGVFGAKSEEVGYANVRLGGIAYELSRQIKEHGFTPDIREAVLGHIQRGGVPTAYDRVLATQFGVKAFEMVLEGKFGHMVSYRHPDIIAVPLEDAVGKPNFVDPNSDIMDAARGAGISFGD
ncbi:MAG: ATP-dependent 6-phosphofructokinase, partial [Rikenellaceae bacterium]